MMPCGWLIIFFLSMMVLMSVSSNWSFFFIMPSLEYKKKSEYFISIKDFWL